MCVTFFWMLLLGILLGVISAFAAVPSNEINYLSEFYHATGGDSWIWRPIRLFGPKWDFTAPDVNPCNTNSTYWQGIECNLSPPLCLIQECHITYLALEFYGLKGTLPDRWNELSALTYLDLGINRLEGTFPRTLVPPIQMKALYFETNNLTGTIPGSILGNMTSLVSLDLSNNGFTGPIPTEIGLLTLLEHLELRLIDFTGGIPSSFGNLHLLTLLDLSGCYINGTIPNEMTQLTSMIFLDFDFNLLTGTIPTGIGSLRNISFLDLSSNLLTGTIPSTIGTLTLFTKLNLNYNDLNGTIPVEMGSLTLLTVLFMVDNLLTGPIPSSFGDLIRLTNLDLLSNHLSGSIPSQLSALSLLNILNIGGNRFTGTIPSAIGGLSQLSWLNLMMNSLTGTIPHEISQLSLLQYFYLAINYLSGPLVCDFSQFLSLNILDFQINYLTGPLCPTFSTKMIDLRLNSNLLTGTIPPGIGLLRNVGFLQLEKNLFTGELPKTIRNMTSLYTLSLAHNHLTHCVPSELGYLVNLRQLYFQSNQFSCGFESILFQASALTWVHLDFSDNIFGGSIPNALYHVSSLASIILTSNCFHGELTSDICISRHLQVIAFDGLSAAHECPKTSLFNLQHDRLLGGSIPACLWSILNLTTVSLSGNGLIGTLSQLPTRSKLQNLTISHNQLTGTIPKSFQNHPFQLLDLSYNRFTGEVEYLTPFAQEDKSHFTLEVNRLSGILNSFDQMPKSQVKLNILTGNLFSCRHLPNTDQSFLEYICGSEDLDRSMIMFGAVSLLILVMSSVLYLTLKYEILSTCGAYIRSSYQTIALYLKEATMVDEIFNFDLILSRISIILLWITMVGIVLLIPLYILRSTGGNNQDQELFRYSTHTHLYRWLLTVAYSTGNIPAILIIVAWMTSISLFVFSFKAMEKGNEVINSNEKVERRRPTFGVIFLLILDILIVGGVNAGYIYSTMQNINSRDQLTIKILLAVFTFLWSEGFARSSHVVLTISYAVFQTIIIPCLATALTSTSCFQTLLIPPPQITTYYEYLVCHTYVIISTEDSSYVVCSGTELQSTNVDPFRPPFSYYFVCFSTILTAYIPVYLYTYCFKITVPVLVSYFLATFVEYSKIPTPIRIRTRGLLWPNHWKTLLPQNSHQSLPSSASASLSLSSNQFSPLNESLLTEEHSNRSDPTPLAPLPPPPQSQPQHSEFQSFFRFDSSSVDDIEQVTPELLFKPARVFGSIAQDFCVLFTFALCSPVLALAVALHSFTSIYHIRFILARFVYLRQQKNRHNDEAMAALEKSLSGSSLGYTRMIWPIVWLSAIFISFLGWEISGDSTGLEKSIWVPITVLVMTAFIQIISSYVPMNSLMSIYLRLLDRFSFASHTTDIPLTGKRDESHQFEEKYSKYSRPSDGSLVEMSVSLSSVSRHQLNPLVGNISKVSEQDDV